MIFFYADIFDSVTYINTVNESFLFDVRFDDPVVLVLYVCEQLKENEPQLIHTLTLIL